MVEHLIYFLHILSEVELLPASTTWVFPCLGLMPFNKSAFENAKQVITKQLELLNAHLLTRTYLVGERITLADISVACTLLRLYEVRTSLEVSHW